MKFLNRLKSVVTNKKILAVLVFVAVLIASGGYALLRSDTQPTAEHKARLVVDSDPAGVSMSENPVCTTAPGGTTIYDCELNAGATIIVTAPKQVEKQGKLYNFVTWDGCSESNVDKSICKVVFNAIEEKTIKATYSPQQIEEENQNQSQSQSAPTGPSAICQSSSTNTTQICDLKLNKSPVKLLVYALADNYSNQGDLKMRVSCSQPSDCTDGNGNPLSGESSYWNIKVTNNTNVRITANTSVSKIESGGCHGCYIYTTYTFKDWSASFNSAENSYSILPLYKITTSY